MRSIPIRIEFVIFTVLTFFSLSPVLFADTVSSLDPRSSSILNAYNNQGHSNLMSTKSQDKWITVEARSDMSSGLTVARRSAMLAAYRLAMLGGNVTSKNEVSHWRTFKDVVNILSKKPNTYIKRFEILDGGIENERQYRVRLKALVVDMFGKEVNLDDHISQFLDLIVEPRIVLLLNEQTGESNKNVGMGNVSITEKVIASKLKKVGYTVLTSKDVKKSVGKIDFEKTKAGDVSYAAFVGRFLNADLVLVGNFTFQSLYDKNPKKVKGLCCNSYKFKWNAIVPGSGKQVNLDNNIEHESTGGNEKRDRNIGMVSAVDKVSDDLKWKILNILSTQTHDIRVVIKNVTNNKADSIKKILATMEGVEKVEMKGWNEEATQYIVKNVYTGPKERDLSAALTKSFKYLRMKSIGKDELVLSF